MKIVHLGGFSESESIAVTLETEVTVSVKAATSAPQRDVVCLLWSHDRESTMLSNPREAAVCITAQKNKAQKVSFELNELFRQTLERAQKL